jgi:glycosyltransferase involved in cell wall biosynthesis
MLAAKRLGMRVLLRDDATLISRVRGTVKLALKRSFFRWLTKLVDAFLAVGTHNRNYYLNYGVNPEHIFDVPWAVDNAFFRDAARAARSRRDKTRESFGLEKGRAIVLFVGKLIERKRPGDLLEAYARLPKSRENGLSCYLIYVGDGALRTRLERRACELGLGSVRFLGFRNQNELPAFYDLCDVFIMPTVDEPWGLVVNEVMNAAKAVVVSDEVGCAPDLVRNGYNGFVYRAGNVAELCAAVSAAVADPERTLLMGRRGLNVIGRWSFEEDVHGLRRALEGCL